ncbi:peptidylprolyl isomerase [Pseudoxanthomonas koreensis]|uniref:peptidylprolyl isomerase n=1 Tax=Pseudoxanthomonas koreensis TaxID=266061 RepID=UPI0035A5FDF8
MTRRLPAILLAVAALLSAPFLAAAQQLQPVEGIAAIVDEEVILLSELELAMRNVMAQYAGREDQLPPRPVLERQVLERLVLVRLQVARARAHGIRITEQQLNQTVATVAQQNGLTVEALRQRLAEDGLGFEEFRRTLADEIMVQQLRQSRGERVNVSEGEVDIALERLAAGGQQYRLAHIVVALPDGATAEQIATGQGKIDGIKNLIDKGELDFAAAAVRYSDSPNALEGGDLGWRSLDEIPPAFSKDIQALQPGQILGPVRGPSGFQLLLLADLRDSSYTPAARITEYHVRHILVRIHDRQDEDAARAKIDALHARIEGGEEFPALAREASEDSTTRNQGGDLGWFPADAYGEEFGSEITALEDGQVSRPFRSEAGWHVIERVASRESDVTDLNRRAQVRDTIGRRKLEEDYERYLQELRSEAYVVLRVGDRAEPVTGAQTGG